jgi:hypothetical protein
VHSVLQYTVVKLVCGPSAEALFGMIQLISAVFHAEQPSHELRKSVQFFMVTVSLTGKIE